MIQASIPGFTDRHKMKRSSKYGYLCFFLCLVVMLGTAQEKEVNGTTFGSSLLTPESSLMYQNSDNHSRSDVIHLTSLEKVFESMFLINGSFTFQGTSLKDDLESNSFQVTTAPQWDLIELSLSNDSCIVSQYLNMCNTEFLSQDDICSAIHALYFLGDHPVEGNVFMALVVGVENLRHINISQRGETKKVTLCSNNPKEKSVFYFVFAFYKDEEVVFNVDKELKINHAEEFIEYLIPLPVECRTILMTSILAHYMTPSYIIAIDVTSSIEYHDLCLPALSHRSNLTTLSSGNTFYVASFCYIFLSNVSFVENGFCEISLRNPATNEEVNACVDISETSQSFFYHGLIRYNYYFLWYDSNNEFCKIWSKNLPKGPAGSKVLRDKKRIWMWIYEKPTNRTLLAEGNRMSTAIILHIHNMSSCIVALENAFVFDESIEYLDEVSETYFLSVSDSEINLLCFYEAQNLTNQILHENRGVDFTENFPLVSFSTEDNNYSLFTLTTWDESFHILFAKKCSKIKRSQAHYLVTGILCNDKLDWNFFCRNDIYLSWQLKLSNYIDFTSLCSSDSSQVNAMMKDLEKIPGNWVWTYVDHLCGSEIWDVCMDVHNQKELGKLLGSQWSLASQYVDYFSMTCINYRINDNPVILFFNKKVKCHTRSKEAQQFILGVFDPENKNYNITRPNSIQTNMSDRDWVNEITISNIPNRCPLFSWESNDKQFILDILTGSIYNNDTACMEHICTGSLESRCIYERCSPIRFGPLEKSLYTISCFRYLPGSLWWDINEAFRWNRTTINWFWAIESYNYLIVYDNKEKVTSLDWDYLSRKAMAWEIFLVTVTIVVTASLILGNFLVIFVMVTGGQRGEISGILRNSLAVSDFLTGLFPCSLAVSDAICLMTGRLTLYDLDSKSVLSSFDRLVSDILPPGLTELKFERFGYPAFCSLVFAVSSTSSLLTHFCLAIERYRAVSAAAVRGTVFNTPKKKAVAVMVPWMTAITFAVVCGSGNGSFLMGYLDPLTKLTLWLPTSGTLVVSTVFFWLQFGTVAIFIIATLIGTLISVKTFTEERKREMKESQAYYVPSEEEVIQNKTILRRGRTTLFLTAILLAGSVLPMAVSSFWEFPRYLPVFHYLMWWLFIAGMSCNWIVYNMRSKLFYSDMAESLLLLKAILPAWMIRILENRVTDPRHPPPVSEEDQIDLYQCVFQSARDKKNASKIQKEDETTDEDLKEVCNGSLSNPKDGVNTTVKSGSIKETTQGTLGVNKPCSLNNNSAIIENGNGETQRKQCVHISFDASPEPLTIIKNGNGENGCQHLQNKKDA